MPHPEISKSKTHVVFESFIDNRTIVCGCGNKECKIGLSFDSEPDIMRLTDKYGNEHGMHLNRENIKELIKHLKSFI